MHPRLSRHEWTPTRHRQAAEVLAFIAERGCVHPRQVDDHFAHGRATNWFGGTSRASTQLLDAMHYRGLLRVARRESGTRLYSIREARAIDPPIDVSTDTGIDARTDALVDIIVAKYAPLPGRTLSWLVHQLRSSTPRWEKHRLAALARARTRLGTVRLAGHDWYWPAGESPRAKRWLTDSDVRLLTPFDPVVWDRRRFELFWGWAYRFEAYTPAAKRKLGYYAMPLLWQDQIVGWGNLSVDHGRLRSSFGYVSGTPPVDPAFSRGLQEEILRMQTFLRLSV